MSNRAWVTLATNDSYGLGALVLAHSLRRAGSVFPAVVLITPAVTEAMRERLRAVFAEVIVVDVLDSGDATHLALLQRPELGITFTKIHCWNLTQYEKCVFLDADTLVIQNSDELFEREELSAAPDVGWPDCFNSGVFVYKPSQETFNSLITFAQERGSFDGGDQGLLNSFFSNWARGDINKHLPFLYNVTSAAFYSYLPALKHFGADLKIIHFIGVAKPWLQNYNWQSHSVDAPGHLKETLQLWWDIFASSVHTQLDQTMVEEDTREEFPSLDNTNYYVHEVNPDSEFPWHRSNNDPAQIEQEQPKPYLSDIFDPWDLYHGNIPSHPDEEVSDVQSGKIVMTQELRDYAWAYKAQQIVEETSYDLQISQKQHGQHCEHQWHPPSHDQHGHNDQSHPHSHSHGHQHHHHHNSQPQPREVHPQNHHYHHDQSHQQWESESYTNKELNRSDHQVNLHNHQQNNPESDRSTKHEKIVQQVHHAKVETKLTSSKQRRPLGTARKNNPIDIYCEGSVLTNGFLSEDDGDYFDDFRPRHPYDGFYLRHRSTIDSRGRKVCLHQIPPTPPPSPPPDSSEPSTEDEADLFMDSQEYQTGVAGNLARVTPGMSNSAAIDELSRRQGWEAGNIDYMGADSFANIWAKISSTLNQAPTTEPSPPKESTPAKGPSPPKEQLAAAEPSPAPEPAPVKQQSPPKEAPVKQPSPPKAAAPVKQPSPPKEATPVKQPSPPKEVAPPTQPSPVEESRAPQPSPPVEETPAPQSSPPVEETPAPQPSPPVEETPAPQPSPPVEETPAPQPSPPVEATPAPQPLPVEATPVMQPPPIEAAPVTQPSPPIETIPAKEPSSPKEQPAPASTAPVQAPQPAPEPKTVPPTPPVTPKTSPEASSIPVVETPPKVTQAVNVASNPEAALAAPTVPTPAAQGQVTPVKPLDLSAASSDSPPLANTPAKDDESPKAPKTDAERARRPVDKLQLCPPRAGDALPTPDSELEDAATLAHRIIASELATPTVTSPTSPALPALPTAAAAAPPLDKTLSVEQPALDTPPAAGPVSLAQIGVQPVSSPPKPKPTIAAQIESSVADKAVSAPDQSSPSEPNTPTDSVPKKKVVKKVVKKDAPAASAAAGGDVPVPPPRKKEKKPKE